MSLEDTLEPTHSAEDFWVRILPRTPYNDVTSPAFETDTARRTLIGIEMVRRPLLKPNGPDGKLFPFRAKIIDGELPIDAPICLVWSPTEKRLLCRHEEIEPLL